MTATLTATASAEGISQLSECSCTSAPPRTTGQPPPTSPLAEYGYEPRREGDRVVMANCPFHALAQTHTELVCRMNHALIGGLIDAVGPHQLEARLDPGENRCCVTLAPRP